MKNLFRNGEFFIGANYWASNAGMYMWSKWDEKCVKRDLDLLCKADIKVLRIFPLWSDFQPIENYMECRSVTRRIAFDATSANDSPEALAGIDPVMVERFDRFLTLCEERGIDVIVGLLTGWMSGRMFIPRALERLNLYTDPTALRWELRFVKYMVRRFKDHKAIAAWDLGNECNCMAECTSADVAYTWTSIISDAIKSVDNNACVVSGMHSLRNEGVWTPMDQGEATDILCTHPYPAFTEYCDTDPINRMKSALHATAESLFYRGCGNKPCFVEEINVLGPMVGNKEVTCAYTDMALFSLWQHNCLGFMWWCACNQSKLENPPYDWCSLERELGLINGDGTHVPMMDRMTDFYHFTKEIGVLPERIVDAVCVLVYNQESWKQAYGSFILAKQAGLDIEYTYCDNALPESKVYLVPGLEMYVEPTKRLWNDLLARVENGAALYISMDGAMMSEFCDITGFEIESKSKLLHSHDTELDGVKITLDAEYDMKLCAKTATVLARNQKGEPVFGVNEYGKGKVYFISSQLESFASTTPGFVDGENSRDFYRIYEKMDLRNPGKLARIDNPTVGITEHIIDENSRYLLVINYEPLSQKTEIVLDSADYYVEFVKSVYENVQLDSFENGVISLTLPGNTGTVIKISKA
ncbi:MAG: cellulase family glycosylhydrolase [Clostridia bacterium]|nr:cellulase family glycosylhydrolase [Clostridia bacterium]